MIKTKKNGHVKMRGSSVELAVEITTIMEAYYVALTSKGVPYHIVTETLIDARLTAERLAKKHDEIV